MKVVAFLCVYNDCDFLDSAIRSIKDFPDRLYIIEGAWQSALKFSGSPRSDEATEEVLRRHVDGRRVVLVRANEPTEGAQRQIGLELARQDGADWCFFLDADEIHTRSALSSIHDILSKTLRHPGVFGFRLNSYNFINGFWRYFDGNYPRICRVTPGARFVQINDVEWPDHGLDHWGPHIVSVPSVLRFYHYSYVRRDPRHFALKMDYVSEESPLFASTHRKKYGYSEGRYRIPRDQLIKDFHGTHPAVIQAHPFYEPRR